MIYKEDWDEAKDRMTAWWNGEKTDRPVIQVFAPKLFKGGLKRLFEGLDFWEFARDPDNPDRAIDFYEEWCRDVYFGGEAYPNLWINLGAGVVGAYFGANPKFESKTVWFGAQWSREQIKGWDKLSEIAFDEGNVWWERTKAITKRAVERGRGKFIVAMTDLGGILDIIASLRGSENLIKDLYMRKEDVKSLSQKIIDVWHKCYDELYGIMKEGGFEGTSTWMGIWSPRKWYPLQCDFASMLSPKLFDEFVLPDLKEQCNRLEDPLYHLDGPGQLCHLDSLLSIDELKAIQWVPGAGEENLGHHCGSGKWYPLYRKILSKDKRLVIALSPNFIKPIVKELSPKGILFQTATLNQFMAKLLVR